MRVEKDASREGVRVEMREWRRSVSREENREGVRVEKECE